MNEFGFASHVFKTRPHKRVAGSSVRYLTRGSRFNPGRLTTAYGFVRAGLDRELCALTSGARVTIEECTGVIGRTRCWARSLVVAKPRGSARGVVRSFLILDDLTN